MRDQGHAVAIMGNHELNALLYHSPGLIADGTDDGYMRAHSDKNMDQHQTFLDEFPVGHPDTAEIMDWFLSLPLFLDLGGVRLVHACWDDARMATIRNRRPNGLLAIDDLQEIALENDATGFVEAVLTTLKGPESELPAPHYFHDIRGHRRTALRLKWWHSGAMTWRDAALNETLFPSLNHARATLAAWRKDCYGGTARDRGRGVGRGTREAAGPACSPLT